MTSPQSASTEDLSTPTPIPAPTEAPSAPTPTEYLSAPAPSPAQAPSAAEPSATPSVGPSVPCRFSGPSGGVAPSTWGQRGMWRTLTQRRPAGAYQLFQTVPVPAHRDVDHVVRALAVLIGRHQSLRTTFRPGPDGRLDQVIHRDGVLPVRVAEIDDQGAGASASAGTGAGPDAAQATGEVAGASTADPEDAAASALTEDFLASEIDLERELGLRMAVVTRAGVARRVVLVYSHLAFDAHAERVLADELRQLLAAASPEDAVALLPPAHQPEERARLEASDKQHRVSQRSLAYWRSTLLAAPPRLSEDREVDPAAPIWSAALTSESAARAEACLVGTYGLGSSALYLGAMAHALGNRLGRTAMTFQVPVSNRFAPVVQHYVANFVQSTVVNVDLTSGTFHALVRRVEQDLMRAYLHARYDPDDRATMLREVEAARPTPFDLGLGFHDSRTPSDKRADADGPPDGRADGRPGDQGSGSAPAAPADGLVPPDPGALGRPSDLTWRCPVARNAHFTVHARVGAHQGRSVLDIGANVTLLSRDEIAETVLATERVLVRAAHGDVPLADLQGDGG